MKKFRFSLQINELAESKEFKKHSFFYECTVEYPTSVRLNTLRVYGRSATTVRSYTI